MTISTISGSTSNTVTLGSGNYASSVIITTMGSVEPSAPGGYGVTGGGIGVSLTNNGTILAGTGVYSHSEIVGVDPPGNAGVGVDLTAGMAVNSGSITGGTGGGAQFLIGTPGGIGVELVDATLNNSGGITGGTGGLSQSYSPTGGVGGEGVSVGGGASFTNALKGTITGGNANHNSFDSSGGVGVYMKGGSGINNGTITGGNGSFGGTNGNGGVGVILTGGATLTNTGTITGGVGGFSGNRTGYPGFGVILDGGTLTTSGAINPGFAGITHGESLTAPAVEFTSTPSTLVIKAGASFTTYFGGYTAADFQVGDTVDITNLVPSKVKGYFNYATYTLSTPDDGTLRFGGTVPAGYDGDTPVGSFAASGDHFVFGYDTSGKGTDITLAANASCYRRGTRILTANGEVAIESLAIGDRVTTLSGIDRPIRWIGRRSYTGDFASGNRDVLPVLIRAGALGESLPRRDLWVSPEHAIFLEGMLIAARALVNGESILQPLEADGVSYVHLEFDTHDVIYAEGAPSESFVDDESRELFENAAEYAILYPDARRKPARFCAPRVEDGEALDAVCRRLRLIAAIESPVAGDSPWRGHVDIVERGRIEGWAQDEQQSDRPLVLRILDNGLPIGRVLANEYRQDLHAAAIGKGYHAFSFSVPGGLDPQREHLIEVQRADDARPLAPSPYFLPASPYHRTPIH